MPPDPLNWAMLHVSHTIISPLCEKKSCINPWCTCVWHCIYMHNIHVTPLAMSIWDQTTNFLNITTCIVHNLYFKVGLISSICAVGYVCSGDSPWSTARSAFLRANAALLVGAGCLWLTQTENLHTHCKRPGTKKKATVLHAKRVDFEKRPKILIL